MFLVCLGMFLIFVFKYEPAKNFFIEPAKNLFRKDSEELLAQVKQERRLRQELTGSCINQQKKIQELKRQLTALEKDYIALVKIQNWRTQEIINAHKNTIEGLMLENKHFGDRIGVLEGSQPERKPVLPLSKLPLIID
jgi:hypothetical protein